MSKNNIIPISGAEHGRVSAQMDAYPGKRCDLYNDLAQNHPYVFADAMQAKSVLVPFYKGDLEGLTIEQLKALNAFFSQCEATANVKGWDKPPVQKTKMLRAIDIKQVADYAATRRLSVNELYARISPCPTGLHKEVLQDMIDRAYNGDHTALKIPEMHWAAISNCLGLNKPKPK